MKTSREHHIYYKSSGDHESLLFIESKQNPEKW